MQHPEDLGSVWPTRNLDRILNIFRRNLVDTQVNIEDLRYSDYSLLLV